MRLDIAIVLDCRPGPGTGAMMQTPRSWLTCGDERANGEWEAHSSLHSSCSSADCCYYCGVRSGRSCMPGLAFQWGLTSTRQRRQVAWAPHADNRSLLGGSRRQRARRWTLVLLHRPPRRALNLNLHWIWAAALVGVPSLCARARATAVPTSKPRRRGGGAPRDQTGDDALAVADGPRQGCAAAGPRQSGTQGW